VGDPHDENLMPLAATGLHHCCSAGSMNCARRMLASAHNLVDSAERIVVSNLGLLLGDLIKSTSNACVLGNLDARRYHIGCVQGDESIYPGSRACPRDPPALRLVASHTSPLLLVWQRQLASLLLRSEASCEGQACPLPPACMHRSA
jgi:hypothetical protein